MTLNEAIMRVITSKFKKDAPEAFKAVSDAGYIMYKVDGHWVVKHPLTERYVTVTGGIRYLGCGVSGYRIDRGWNYRNSLIIYDGKGDLTTKFDFVGCLMTPYNREYYRIVNNATTRQKYDSLKWAKQTVKYSDERIEEIQTKIDKLTRDLISAVENRAQAKIRLNEVRKNLNLKKGVA